MSAGSGYNPVPVCFVDNRRDVTSDESHAPLSHVVA